MISIITITNNRAHLIGETIQSVLAQSYRDFEYIIINDGSEDNTSEVVKAFNDKRIKYYKYSKTGKISKLRNIGLKLAEGEFIAFIDSDDLWAENKLQSQIDNFSINPDADFSIHNVSLFNESGIITENIYDKKEKNFTGNIFHRFINNEISIYPSTLLFRKSCLKQVKSFDEELEEGEHDFISKLCFYFMIRIIYEPLGKIRKHDQNLNSLNIFRVQPYLEYIKTLNHFYTLKYISQKTYRNMLSFNYYKIANSMLNKKSFNEAKEYYLLSFIKKPLSLKGAKALFRFLQCYLEITTNSFHLK